MITEDFTIFQSILEVTKSRGLDVLVLSFSDSIPDNVGVIITSNGESAKIDFDPDKIVPFNRDSDFTVTTALRILNGLTDLDQLVIGIDPGKNPGIAVLENDQVIAVYHVAVREVPMVIHQIQEEYPSEKSIIRIGSGARLVRTQLINSLLDLGFRVEVVDETGTSPAMGRGIHGSEISDIIAAINIARLKGTAVGRQEVEPSMGEIKRIQEHSREHSNGKASIPRNLARKVAKGEITMDEAIELHKQPP